MFFRALVFAMGAASLFGSAPNPALAETGTLRIDEPKVGDALLDWCKELGSKCGQPAADAY